jgi:RimJ/RimL family protein N-acetyltransferase
METLTDGVVTLRRFRDEDTLAIAAACVDPEIARFLPDVPQPYTIDDAHAYLAYATSQWVAGRQRPVAITGGKDDAFLGAIEVRLEEEGSIGYWIAAASRGRGFATRALLLVSRWAVTEGGVERLELTTHPENLASQRVAERAGFSCDERRADAVVFSLRLSDL